MAQAEPKLPDGEDGPPDEEFDGVEEGTIDERWTPTWSDIPDEWCRAHIFNRMCDPDIDGKVLVMNMELAYQWIRHGKVPADAPKGSRLKTVSKDAGSDV